MMNLLDSERQGRRGWDARRPASDETLQGFSEAKKACHMNGDGDDVKEIYLIEANGTHSIMKDDRIVDNGKVVVSIIKWLLKL